jgi:hypothetical protein
LMDRLMCVQRLSVWWPDALKSSYSDKPRISYGRERKKKGTTTTTTKNLWINQPRRRRKKVLLLSFLLCWANEKESWADSCQENTHTHDRLVFLRSESIGTYSRKDPRFVRESLLGCWIPSRALLTFKLDWTVLCRHFIFVTFTH